MFVYTCPKCGSAASDKKFCTECGTKLKLRPRGTMEKNLRDWGIALLLVGLIKGFPGFLYVYDIYFAVIVVILGITNLVHRKRYMYLANAAYFLIVAVFTISVREVGWMFYSFFQLILVSFSVGFFALYKPLANLAVNNGKQN